MAGRQSQSGQVTENNRGSGSQKGTSVRVATMTFRMVMDMAGVSNQQLADATGVSKAYVGQVRAGMRTKVSQRFMSEAGNYLGRVLGETGRLAVGLISLGSEDNAGEK